MKDWSDYEFVTDEEQHLAMPGERTGWETVIFEVESDSPLSEELAAIDAYLAVLRDS